MQPIIYSSLDAGAPQLSLTAGALNTVIKGCLITGYGNKSAAGWEIVYENMNTHKLAIRSTNPQSIKSVLLLDNTNAAYAVVTAYTDWDSATNTGINSFSAGMFVNKWQADNPDWHIVATDKFFYLLIQSEERTKEMRVLTGFGDTKPLFSTQGISVLLKNSSSDYSQYGTGHATVDSSINGIAYFPLSLFVKSSVSSGWGDRTDNIASSTVSSKAIFTELVMYQSIDDRNQPSFILPGILMPFSQINGYTVNSKSYFELINQVPYANPIYGMYQPYHGNVWIHTDDWR